MKTYKDQSPVVGGMVFFADSGYDRTNGHVEVVKSINGDGTMTLKGSNIKGDEKVYERIVPISSATGFYNNTPLAKANQ
jgi:surface antigen